MSDPGRRAPASTYRLQLQPEFSFDDAREVVGYLRRLGVDALYLSPVLDATPGSTHGYDVTDPTRIRPELGGVEAFEALTTAAREAGLGVVVDIVPNHVSVEVPRANPWWWSVLREGRASAYAHHVDIDWSRERLLLPVLGDDGGVADLEVDGEQLAYFDHRFPIDEATLPHLDSLTPQQVHDRQHYELVGWRRGNAELGYRRFFDITTLAAVTVERDEVFEDSHREVLRHVASGAVTGLRVDHPDGLADPGAYAQQLRDAAPEAWIVVEKILHPGEQLPATWPVDGTTGYDALRDVSNVLLDPVGEAHFDRLAERLGVPIDVAAVEEDARRMVTDRILVAEVRRIAALLDGVETEAARGAVAETMIAFGVYRSYLPEGADTWAAAIALAGSRRPDLAEALAALDSQVTGDPDGELATRIQQTSGMVVAKGTEDTTFYRATRFAALNEVGGSPDVWGADVATFHQQQAERQERTPRSMTTLTTHDTKRSEDTRARMLVLAELGPELEETIAGWSERCGLGEPSLDLLAWQTLLGAWPIEDGRLSDYLLKAAKEGKVRTTWTEPDEAFEAEIAAWPARVREVLGDEVAEVAAGIDEPGRVVGLTQKLVQLTMPGVPDVYQGTELWDRSLVDPDNRRAVDYAARTALLDRIDEGWLPDLDPGGAAKLLLVHRTLTLRRERPDLFSGYRPIETSMEAAVHALAFARSDDLVVVGTRLPVGLARRGGWGATTLPLAEGSWTDVITGASFAGGDVPMRDLLDRYPVALLVRSPLASESA